jgi:hypothetical protein
MAINQVSVFVANSQGKLADTIKLISDAGINMRAMSIAETAEFGILRLIVDDSAKAMAALSHDYILNTTPVIAAKMPDTAGALYKVLKVLGDAEINIDYMYAFTGTSALSAYTAFRVDDVKAAEDVLHSKGIETLNDEDIKNI